MVSDKQEYSYGQKKEKELKPLFEKFFDTKLSETKRYDTFDFTGKNITIELKSRRNTKNRYPTTIIGMNKIDKIKEGERVICAFSFTDGVYYWEYEPTHTFETIMIQRRDRRNIPAKPYLSIPIESLSPVE